MKLSKSAHTSQPWRIHELTPDFRLEDVWALPTPGGPDDFPRLVRLDATDDPRELNAQGKYVGDGSRGLASRVSRALFELRWKLGELLGWTIATPALAAGSPRCATGCRPICATLHADRTSGRCR